MEKQQKIAVLLTNRLSLILFILNAVTAVAIVWMYVWSPIVMLVLCNNVAYIAVLLLNHLAYHNGSRLLLSLFLPLSTLAITIWGKYSSPYVEESSFYSSRVVLLVASILPLIIFQLRERRLLYTGLAASALCLLFYDLAHYLFGVAYYQLGFAVPGYRFFNLVVLIVYVLLVSAFLYYKKMLEHAERELSESHGQLKHLYAELGLQHEEIYAQAEKLLESQQQLQQANHLIAQQKSMLEAENVELHQHLLEKNIMLESSNQELQGRLEELRQFSYTISHNLRGPVASLLGLCSLFDYENAYVGNRQLIIHISSSAQALDNVIRELSQVLQIGEGKEALETIELDHLVQNVLLSLKHEKENCPVISRQLEIGRIKAVKSYIHSILFNLISNAMKFRHPDRPCEINIRARQADKGFLLEVEDNGSGIDLQRHGPNLFKMYKRFNENREGRGLGLYLTKVQAEMMKGYVELESEPDVGTTVRVWLPRPEGAKT